MRLNLILGILVFSSLMPLFGQIRPITNFFVLPDDVPGPGSSSMGLGTVAGTPVSLDFTTTQTEGRGGFLTLGFQPGTPTDHLVLEMRFPGRDPATGAELELTLDAGGGPAIVTSTAVWGFPTGGTMTLTAPVAIATSGLPGAPLSGTLTMSGTIVAGFHHRVCLMTGSVDSLPGMTLSMFIKEDAFVPGIEWHYVLDNTTSSLTAPGGVAEALVGHLSIVRDPLAITQFQVAKLNLGSTSHTVGLGAGSSPLTTDPVTGTLVGSLDLLVNGSPLTLVFDGLGDFYDGESPRPESLRVEASGLPGLDGIVIEARRVELVPDGSVAGPGLNYTPLFRGPPGFAYIAGASFDPAPGLNTPLGDVPLDLDALLVYSTSPNPFFLNMSGLFSASGRAYPQVVVPNDPGLAGIQFFLGGIVIDPLGAVIAVTQPHRVTL